MRVNRRLEALKTMKVKDGEKIKAGLQWRPKFKGCNVEWMET